MWENSGSLGLVFLNYSVLSSSTNNTKQAVWVAIGSIFSYCFTLISSMLLSRFFDKGDYGTYHQVLFVYHTLLSVFTLGLPKAYSFFLPRVENNEAKDVIDKINMLFFILGGVFSLTLFIGSPFIASSLKNPELTKALRIFSPVPFLMLPTMGLEGILATYKRTKAIALYTFVTRLTHLLCICVPVVFFHGTYIDAIIGFTIASVVSFILALYLKYLPVKPYDHGRCELKYKEILSFSLPLMTASIWGILINSTDQFFISHYFGKWIYAEFSNGAIEFPVATLIISACSTVLTPLFSRQAKEGGDYSKSILPVWISTIKKACMIIYPLLIICIYDAKPIMSVLYGSQYINSGDYFAIKLFTNFVKVIPYAAILIAIGSVKFYSKVMMYIFLGLVSTEFISIKLFNSPQVLVIIHTCFIVLMALLFVLYVGRYMGVNVRNIVPFSTIGKILIISLICLLVVYLLGTQVKFSSPIVSLGFDLIIYCVLFMGASFFAGIDYLNIVRPLLKR